MYWTHCARLKPKRAGKTLFFSAFSLLKALFVNFAVSTNRSVESIKKRALKTSQMRMGIFYTINAESAFLTQ